MRRSGKRRVALGATAATVTRRHVRIYVCIYVLPGMRYSHALLRVEVRESHTADRQRQRNGRAMARDGTQSGSAPSHRIWGATPMGKCMQEGAETGCLYAIRTSTLLMIALLSPRIVWLQVC